MQEWNVWISSNGDSSVAATSVRVDQIRLDEAFIENRVMITAQSSFFLWN